MKPTFWVGFLFTHIYQHGRMEKICGWTEHDLKNPPYYTEELMYLHSNFAPKVQEIIQTINDYGFNVDGTEVHYYIMDKLRHIDDITPLN